MNSLYLIDGSALMYWRAVCAGIVPHPAPSHTVSLADSSGSQKELQNMRSSLFFSPETVLDIAVDTRTKRHRLTGFKAHLCSKALPPKAFYCISNNVYVASPEFCFVRLVQSELMLPLAELAMELCGTYALYEGAERGFQTLAKPLCTLESLENCCAALDGEHGVAKARKVLSLVAEGAASPRETELFLALTLPLHLGGLGFPKPRLAQIITTRRRAIRLADSDYYVADLLWQGKSVIAEYDGAFDHSGDEASTRDKNRRSALASLGYKVIVFSNADVTYESSFRLRTDQLAHALGVKLTYRNSQEIREKQIALFRYLFSISHHGKSIATTPLYVQKRG